MRRSTPPSGRKTARAPVEVARGYSGRAGKAGRAAAGQRLREYEQLIPTKGNDLTKEEVERNKGYIRALGDARKVLG